MKTAFHTLLALLPLSLFAQGPLDPPPDGPQPTMKTLQQVEPRVDLFNAPDGVVTTDDPTFSFVIRREGSYYLSRDLVVGGVVIGGSSPSAGVRIDASGVTLDLNGFAIRGLGGVFGGNDTGQAIRISNGVSGVTIRNGAIRGRTTVSVSGVPSSWTSNPAGFSYGINGGTGCVFRDLVISGCSEQGISSGANARIESCTVTQNGLIGGMRVSSGLVRDCLVTLNDGDGIDGNATVMECVVRQNSGFGVRGQLVQGCEVFANGNNGIEAKQVTESLASGNQGRGIRAEVIGGSTAESNGMDGIEALGSAAGCVANRNGGHGFRGSGSFSDCSASRNDGNGFEFTGSTSVTGCRSVGNEIGFSGSRLHLDGCGATDNAQSGFVTPESQLADCEASGNNGYGFVVNDGALAGCLARDNRQSGFGAVGTGSSFRDCTAHDNDDYGFFCGAGGNVFHDCRATRNGQTGITAGSYSVVKNCLVFENDAIGIIVLEGGTVVGNNASRNGLDGIRAGSGSRVADNMAHRNGRLGEGSGILLPTALLPEEVSVHDNQVTRNDYGIRVQGRRNVVWGNFASRNGTMNYEYVGYINDVAGVLTPRQQRNNGTNFFAPFESKWLNFELTEPDTIYPGAP